MERSARVRATAFFRLASRHPCYFVVTIDRMSVFVTGVQNSQEITHERRLADCKAEARTFVRTMQGLDDTLGPLLLQLPPDITAYNREILNEFLADLPEEPRYAVEVRHQSWLDSDLLGLLR